jgi:hypothetical protein
VRRYPESKLRIRHYSVESVEDAGPIRGPAGRFVQRRRVRAKNPRSDKEMGVGGGSWVSWSGKEKSGLELGGGRGGRSYIRGHNRGPITNFAAKAGHLAWAHCLAASPPRANGPLHRERSFRATRGFGGRYAFTSACVSCGLEQMPRTYIRQRAAETGTMRARCDRICARHKSHCAPWPQYFGLN